MNAPMWEPQLNEVWYAVHTLREQDPDGLISNRWDEVCGALSQIAEALGHDSFEAEDPTDGNPTFNHCIVSPIPLPFPDENLEDDEFMAEDLEEEYAWSPNWEPPKKAL